MTFLDITERKWAEEALRESENELARFKSALDQTLECVFMFRPEGFRFVYVNEGAMRQVGYSEAELLTMSPLDIRPTHTLASFQQMVQGLLAGTPSSLFFETVHRHKDGHDIPVEINVQFVQQMDREPRFVAIARDITERKRAEEEKLGLERQIQQAQKLESLGVLAGGIAHDFNNILATILGNADLALERLSPHSPARINIQDIEKASRRAADLAKQMLAYSGKGRFVVEPIDLGEFIEEMAHLLEVSISKKAVLKYNFADNLPPFNGDATQIRQIIVNLIINATEAIGNRSGVIAISTGAMHCDHSYLEGIDSSVIVGLEEPLAEDIYVYLEVADTGCGMDAKTLEKIFDPFFTTKFTGRGLGLSATLGIVRGHKGAIKIYSEVGKGTTFKVLFPASESPVHRAALPEEEGVAGTWHGEGTILIVDDEETICAMGRQMVEYMGFTALTAADGREALEVFREHSAEIVCVLLDLTMPHMDGEETFRELRRMQPNVKVILCSGYNSQTATQNFTGKGLAGFIQKPYRMALLKETLAQLLGS